MLTADDVKKVFQELKMDVWNYLMSLTGHPDDADDMLQIVFIKLLKAFQRRSFKPGEVRNLVFRLAYNAYVDRHRRRGSEQRLLKSYFDKHEEMVSRSFDKSAIIHELLLQALHDPGLTQKKKVILRLRLLGGYSADQIAQMLNMSRPTVYREIKSAFQFLRRVFEEAGLTPEDLE